MTFSVLFMLSVVEGGDGAAVVDVGGAHGVRGERADAAEVDDHAAGGGRVVLDDDVAQVLPIAIMLISMPVTGSIGHGIGLAIIAYVITALLTGKKDEISWLTYILALLFILKFFLVV